MSSLLTTPSNPSLIPPTGDPEHILRDQESFCTLSQCKNLWQIYEAKQKLIHTSNQVFESLHREDLPQLLTACAQLTLVAPNLEIASNPRFSEQLRCKMAQEVKREFAKRFHEAMQ